MWALLCWSALASAAEVEVGLLVRPEVAIDLAADRLGEDGIEAWTRIQGKASGRSDTGKWMLSVQAVHVARGPTDGSEEAAEAWWFTQVGESGLEGKAGPLWLRGGMLIERWGGLDLLPVADVINPVDRSAGPLVPQDWARVPVPLLSVQTTGAPLQVVGVFVPFPQADRAELWGGDWALLRQGMVEGLVADAQTWEGDALTEGLLQDTLGALGGALGSTDPGTRRNLGRALGQSGRPEDTGLHPDAAVRLELATRRLDAAVFAATLVARTPTPTLAPELVAFLRDRELPGLADQERLLELAEDPLAGEWPRSYVFGAELGGTLGPFGLRAEGTHRTLQVVSQHWLGASQSPAWTGGLAADWASGSTFQLVVEGRWHHLVSPPSDPLLMRQDDAQVAVGMRWALFGERVHIQPGGIYAVHWNEYAARPLVAWRVSDPVEITAGAIVLGGPHAPASTFREAVTYPGGPFGYWGDNDALTVSAAWIH